MAVAIMGSVLALREEGCSVAVAHIRHLNPFPANIEEILNRYETVIVPENNTGQLKMLLQGRFLKPITGINELKGRAFHVHELRDRIRDLMQGGAS